MRSRHSWPHSSVAPLALLVGLSGLVVVASGCPLRDLLRPATTPGLAPPATATPSAVQLTALPMYRLLVSDVLADVPSRLIAVYVRVYAKDEAAVNVTDNDFTLTLVSGDQGRVFDRARAVELLHRTTLGDADMSYLELGATRPPGGIIDYTQAQVRGSVLSRLFPDAQLSPSNSPIEGYVIVDTYQPIASLAGATMGVTTRRVDDGSLVQATYQFVTPLPRTPTPVPAAVEPQPAPGLVPAATPGA